MEFNIISFIFIYSPADSRSLGSGTGFCVRVEKELFDIRGRELDMRARERERDARRGEERRNKGEGEKLG